MLRFRRAVRRVCTQLLQNTESTSPLEWDKAFTVRGLICFSALEKDGAVKAQRRMRHGARRI
jgi:hypothetical protein